MVLGHTADFLVFTENFANDPAQHDWKSSGETSLFHWNSTNQNLEVTWDSSKTNSYFYHPLGTVLARDDSFTFSFDLRLSDIAIGTTPGKSDTFQIAVGLINIRNAAQSNYVRGAFGGPSNLMEFLYYPDSGWGATISSTMIDRTATNWVYGFILDELTPGDLFHVNINYDRFDQTFYTSVTRNGQFLGSSSAWLGTNFIDFRVDAFSISSYSDAGQPPDFAGSVLAHGTIDNIAITLPGWWQPLEVPLVVGDNHPREVQFYTRTNWYYRLEGTADFKNWSEVTSRWGTDSWQSAVDTNVLPMQFYRAVAERP